MLFVGADEELMMSSMQFDKFVLDNCSRKTFYKNKNNALLTILEKRSKLSFCP